MVSATLPVSSPMQLRGILVIVCLAVSAVVVVLHSTISANRWNTKHQWRSGISEQVDRRVQRISSETHSPPASNNSTDWTWHRFLPADGNCLPNYFLNNSSKVERDRYKKAIVGFQHLNKAGGQTMHDCIRSLRQKNRVDFLMSAQHRLEAEIHLDFGTLTADDIDIYHGDYFFGMCERLTKSRTNRSCTYFTLLRDPYERVISSYYYCQKNNYDQTCGPYFMDRFKTIDEWAVHQGSYFFFQLLQRREYCKMGDPAGNEFAQILRDNLPRSGMLGHPHQCWFLQKTILDSIITDVDRQQLLDYLESNLENIFAVIGMADKMPETFLLLREVYGIPFTKCKGSKVNSGQNHKTYASIKSKLLMNPEVTNVMREDVVLYNKAKDIFKREITQLQKLGGLKLSKKRGNFARS